MIMNGLMVHSTKQCVHSCNLANESSQAILENERRTVTGMAPIVAIAAVSPHSTSCPSMRIGGMKAAYHLGRVRITAKQNSFQEKVKPTGGQRV